MTINTKRDDLTLEDFDAVGRIAGLPRGRARRIVAAVTDVVADWPAYAQRTAVDDEHRGAIKTALRLDIH